MKILSNVGSCMILLLLTINKKSYYFNPNAIFKEANFK